MTQLKLEMGRVDGVDLLKNFLVFAGRSLHNNGADGVRFLPDAAPHRRGASRIRDPQKGRGEKPALAARSSAGAA